MANAKPQANSFLIQAGPQISMLENMSIFVLIAKLKSKRKQQNGQLQHFQHNIMSDISRKLLLYLSIYYHILRGMQWPIGSFFYVGERWLSRFRLK